MAVDAIQKAEPHKMNTENSRGRFAAWLRMARKAQGKTQADVAEIIGVDQSRVSDIERGVAPTLTAQQVKDIAHFLHADESDALKAAGYWRTGESMDEISERLAAAWRSLRDDDRLAIVALAERLSKAA